MERKGVNKGIIIGIVIALIVIIFCISVKVLADDKIYKLNQKADMGKYQITLSDFRNTKSASNGPANVITTDGNFVIVNMSVVNIGNSPLESLAHSEITLKADGNTYKENSLDTMSMSNSNSYSNLFNVVNRLNPGVDNKVSLVFRTGKPIKSGIVKISSGFDSISFQV